MQPECIVDSPSQSNILIESNVSVYENIQICIFCNLKTKTQRLKRLPLHSSNKNDFLKKLDGENEAFTKLINKVQNSVYSTIYYHIKCQLDFSYEISSKKKIIKTNLHDIRQLHQAVFDEMFVFI